MIRRDKILVSQLTGWRRTAGKTPGIITQTVVRMETIRIRAEGGGWGEDGYTAPTRIKGEAERSSL